MCLTLTGAFLAQMSFYQILGLASFLHPAVSKKSPGYQISDHLDLFFLRIRPCTQKLDWEVNQILGWRYPQCFVDVAKNGLVRAGW